MSQHHRLQIHPLIRVVFHLTVFSALVSLRRPNYLRLHPMARTNHLLDLPNQPQSSNWMTRVIQLHEVRSVGTASCTQQLIVQCTATQRDPSIFCLIIVFLYVRCRVCTDAQKESGLVREYQCNEMPHFAQLEGKQHRLQGHDMTLV